MPSRITRNLVVSAFIAASVVWAVWLIVTPTLPAPLAAITYALGSFICHQRPERSFHLGVAQLPVCARCIGVYSGVALASLCWSLIGQAGLGLQRPTARKGLSAGDEITRGRLSWWPLVLAAMPTAVTLVLEWADIWKPSNIVRTITGAPLGFAVALVVITALTTLHYDECAPPRPIAPRP